MENEVSPKDRAEWRRWLERHHATSGRVWLVMRKKDSRAPGVTYEEAIEEALCFGWVDGQAKRLDGERSGLSFSPRRSTSGWAATNKRRVEQLIASGRMTEAGLAAVERAKANGSWSALDASEALIVPEDLAASLRANPAAERHFEAFPPSARKMALAWIYAAKRPETRAKRVAETVRLAAENRRVDR
jgi:uncharacterized protein YdeI (YjbR/CyaY-like superfamily)